jgi:threonine/homoserine/homoserine lactone efflux protein
VHPRAKAQRLEMLIGILGFFTFMAFVSAVVAEVRDRPALFPAMVLLGFVILTYLAIRARRRVRIGPTARDRR